MDEKGLKAKVRAANRDWLSEVQSKDCELAYDYSGDILYVSFGPSRDTFLMPVEDGANTINLRLALETYKITGFEILTCRNGFLKRDAEAAAVLSPMIRSFGKADWSIKVTPLSAKTKAIFRLFVPKLVSKMAPDLVAA